MLQNKFQQRGDGKQNAEVSGNMMDYFKARTNWYQTIANLTENEVGRLFKSIYEYAHSGEIVEPSGNERGAFWMILGVLQEDNAKREDISEKRRKAGSAGGTEKSKRSKCKQNVANVANATFAKEETENPCETTVSADSVSEENADGAEKWVPLSPTPPITSGIYINNNNIQPSLFDGEETEEVRDKGSGEKGKKKPSALSERKKQEEELLARFEKFWDAYGYKENRKDALREFRKINPDDALLQKMLESIERYHRGRKWQEGYKKYGSTWLHGECWNNEYDDERGAEQNGSAQSGRTYSEKNGGNTGPRTVYTLKPRFAGHKYDADGNDITES